jgi:hypothetical protein
MELYTASILPLFEYLVDAVILIVIGILIANILVESGLFSRLSRLSRPLCRISGLSPHCTVSLLAMFVNPTAGKAMFADLYSKDEVTKEEVIPTLVMSTFPVVIGESLFRIQMPVAIVLLGPVVGTLYVALNLFSSFLQTAGAIGYTRLVMKKDASVLEPDNRWGDPASPVQFSREVILRGIQKGIPELRRILPVTIAAVLIFAFLLSFGLLEIIGALFAPVLGAIGLPGESSTALMAQIMRSFAGYAVVAGLITTGILTLEQALVTLVLGSMLVITLIYIRYSFPLYLSLYGKFGIRVTLITYLSSMAAKVITLALVMLLV